MTDYLRFARKLAKKLSHVAPALDFEERVQVIAIALWRAESTFDATKDLSFNAYATYKSRFALLDAARGEVEASAGMTLVDTRTARYQDGDSTPWTLNHEPESPEEPVEIRLGDRDEVEIDVGTVGHAAQADHRHAVRARWSYAHEWHGGCQGLENRQANRLAARDRGYAAVA